jgi:DNA end-binding protein Ku
MAARPSWSGFLRFNLISVPVKGYNAVATGSSKTGFHLLHKTCHSRIRYKKVCPIHGEVENDEIVSGYEVAKGQYVIVEANEKGELKSEDDKAISVDTFVHADAIPPVYYAGRAYYLLPDGKVAQKPYAVLMQAMQDQERAAVAQVVFSGKMHLALVQPIEGVLTMSILNYESEVKQPASFADEVHAGAASGEELKLADTLIEAATAKHFDLGKYKDEYAGKLAKLVEGKAKKQKITVGGHEEPAVINLMEALKRSLDATGHNGREKKHAHKARATRKKTG